MINKDSRANWWQTPIEECLVAVNPGFAGGRWRRMRPWLENIEPFNEALLLPLLIGDEEAGYFTEEEFTAA